jgi:predicted neutral ceramidase superfamily lipid hydrolase
MSQEQVDNIKKAVNNSVTKAQEGMSEAEKRFNEGAAVLSTNVRKGVEQTASLVNSTSARLQVWIRCVLFWTRLVVFRSATEALFW